MFKKQKPIVKKTNGSTASRARKENSKQSYQEFMKKKYEDLGLEEEYDKMYRPAQKVSKRQSSTLMAEVNEYHPSRRVCINYNVYI